VDVARAPQSARAEWADVALLSGEVVGLVGENGSGKSTLIKILVGAMRPDAGTVTRVGRLGYCPQEPVIYERLTCDEHYELFGRAYRMNVDAERRSPEVLPLDESYAGFDWDTYLRFWQLVTQRRELYRISMNRRAIR
jgi:ABC-2 type transport system ATP-binding protein